MFDEGFKSLYSLLLIGKPVIKDMVYNDDSIHIFTQDGFIHLNFVEKKFEVYGTKFYNGRLIIPAAQDYKISVIGNWFNG